MMKKSIKRLGLGLLFGLLFFSFSTVATTTASAASKWHTGTPKVMRGTWYIKKQSALKVNKGGYAYYEIWYSKHYHGYYVRSLSFNFTTKAKYRSLGHHKYQIKAFGEGGHNEHAGKWFKHTFKVTKKSLYNGTGYKWTKKRPKHMVNSKKADRAFFKGLS